VARAVEDRGGQVHLGHRVVALRAEDHRVTGVVTREESTGRTAEFVGDHFFSSMPVRDLVRAMDPSAPNEVRQVAAGLVYRDFITVGLLLKKLRIENHAARHGPTAIPDCWLYIQEPDVKIGRIQVFNNWSPYLVADPGTTWVGLEYFCTEGDDLWQMPDDRLRDFAVGEMCKIGFIERADVLDGTVLRTPKAYPAYFGTYHQFSTVRAFTDTFQNLYLIGRNGMHRYNNQDHSMLTALTAVENVVNGRMDKSNIWAVNTEKEYHEEK
jgi:protoporphyrinogen oxidase